MVEHIWSLSNIKLDSAWLTIGTFDGVHLGHQAILRSLRAGAQKLNAPAVVLTFHPQPAVVFKQREIASSLTTPDERAKIMGEMGMDFVITHPFNLQTAGITAEEFITTLKSKLGFTWLGVGEDFALGKGRQGNVEFLRSLGDKYGYHLEVFSPVEMEGERISSSRIRLAVKAGDVQMAAKLLGRSYVLSGEVVRGEGRGRKLGIPTANLKLNPEKLVPASGVYACRVVVGQDVFPAAVNIGVRPTFDGDQTTSWVEAHLLDYSSDLYGQAISVEFIHRLRGEKRFSGVEELLEQIHRDIQTTRDTVPL